MIDQYLIEECRGGNLSRFRELVRLTAPFAYSVAFRMLGDEENARDVVQDTMVTIWQKITKIRSAAAYKMWIYRIVMNRCYDKLRQQKATPEFTSDDKTWKLLAETISDGQEPMLEKEEITAVITMLTARLSPKQKSVFILSEIEQLSSDEISGIIGMSKTSVKSNLYFARKSISELLQKYMR